MGFSNVGLRGSRYWWRKKMTVAGVRLTLALPIGAMSFTDARVIALRLGSVAETLRMGYGERSSGVRPDQLKKVFSDALRWQLQRILEDHIASSTPAADHASLNSRYAEAWTFLSKRGVDAKWSLDDHERLIDTGWDKREAKAVADTVFDLQSGSPVSAQQIDTYVTNFGIAPTTTNLDKLRVTICAAKAVACRKATANLSDGEVPAKWVDEALADDTPFAWAMSSAQPSASFEARSSNDPVPPAVEPVPVKAKQRLTDAADACIAVHQGQRAWDAVTVQQVRTAIRLFDHACGGDVFIEDIAQEHVTAFIELCRALPNRWGRTTEERAGGIAASLERAKAMAPDMLGVSQITINKHITWITAVLDHAEGANDEEGHRPAEPITFKKARKGIGKKARQQRKRDREKRANWTKQEVRQLLSAPIWTGTAGIDSRLKPGSEILHDAWYWLPLMLPLYGGRSSELAGLPLSHVHEDEPIPYLQIDFTEDRGLKNVQSVRKLPIHPELIRLGFIDYVRAIRAAGCTMLFPEMASLSSSSFASTFYKSIFKPWRAWAFPEGTPWRHQVGGAWKDKDVHSFRGTATSMLKGVVPDSVRCDIFGHEGETETARTYDEEANLSIKLEALKHLTPLTEHIPATLPIRIRPANRLKFGVRVPSRLGRPKATKQE
ncbi:MULTISPECIES: hypothetical protein [unclassified Sphingomonas]|uniref:hypothetical protein n=1 Tax=unclassified Sphingomonas TaxID=196159 RepID=UPI00285A6126|nr:MULTISPECIES: hypothetical protein [unclassified Sphingomonas]MDR6116041.1 hypothetical protein [Sphingomonas sp. SORGH_AS_0789]MDR6150286.1 hypothetical protein [Sphingomonas sp. SORGH_AS_0742]